MIKAKQINVFGKVQGVGFRYSAIQKANELGITGFVKNRIDGSVYIEVEGEEVFVEQFILWCKTGPSWSRVDNILIADIPLSNYKTFVIK